MDCWNFLKITPTKDKKEIKKAYSKLLPVYHPEKDHEGFMKLRQAYEEAIKEAEREEETVAEKSEVDLWIDKVESLYNNFKNRLAVSKWQELLDEDVCISLDTTRECSERLLIFLAEHIIVSHEVLKLLDDFFLWSKKKQQLYELFPRNYIDYICANAKYPDNFRFALLKVEDGVDYDAFFENYFALENAIQNQKKETIASLLADFEQHFIEHPDFIEILIRGYLLLEKHDRVLELWELLKQRWSEDNRVKYCLARTKLELKEYEEAISYFDALLTECADHLGALVGKASCYKEMSEYEKAVACVKKAEKLAPYDGYIRNFSVMLYEGMIAKYKEKYEKEKSNEAAFAYCKVLAEAYHFEEAVAVLPEIDKTKVNETDYCELCAKSYMDMENENCEKAIPYLERLIELYPDKLRYYEDLGYCYGEAKRLEGAKQIYAKAKEIDETSPRIYYRLAQIYIKEQRYEDAVKICDTGLAYNDQLPNLYHFKAEAYYYLHEYAAALELCDHAISILPYIDTYEIKTKILNECEQYETVLNIISELEQAEFMSDELLVQKSVAKRHMGHTAEAKEILDKLIQNNTNNSNVYYQRGIIAYSEEEYPLAVKYANQAMATTREFKSEYPLLLNYTYLRMGKVKEALNVYLDCEQQGYLTENMAISIADLYMELRDADKALEYLLKVYKDYPQSAGIHGRLCDAYMELENYEDAMREVDLQLEEEPSDYYYIDKGIIYGETGCKQKALENYKMALTYNRENCYAYSNIAFLCLEMGELSKALEYFVKAIKNQHPNPSNYIKAIQLSLRLKRFEEGEWIVQSGMKKYPKNERLFLEAAGFYKEFKDLVQCEKIYQSYGKISGRKEEMLRRIAGANLACGKVEESLRLYKEAISLDSKLQDAYKGIAEIYQDYIEDNQKALKYYKKAFKLDDKDSYVCSQLGVLYEQMGKRKKASAFYLKAFELDMEEAKRSYHSPCSMDCLGMDYAWLGDYDKAILFFARAMEWGKRCEYCFGSECYEVYYDIADAMERKAFSLESKSSYNTDIFCPYEELDVLPLAALKSHIAKLKNEEFDEEYGLIIRVSKEVINAMEELLSDYEKAVSKEQCLAMALRYYKKAYAYKADEKYLKAVKRLKRN